LRSTALAKQKPQCGQQPCENEKPAESPVHMGILRDCPTVASGCGGQRSSYFPLVPKLYLGTSGVFTGMSPCGQARDSRSCAAAQAAECTVRSQVQLGNEGKTPGSMAQVPLAPPVVGNSDRALGSLVELNEALDRGTRARQLGRFGPNERRSSLVQNNRLRGAGFYSASGCFQSPQQHKNAQQQKGAGDAQGNLSHASSPALIIQPKEPKGNSVCPRKNQF
jgi:hypothetical protein